MDQNTNVNTEIIKLREEKTVRYHRNISGGKGFCSSVQITDNKSRNRQVTKSFCIAEETLNRVKKKRTAKSAKIFSNCQKE